LHDHADQDRVKDGRDGECGDSSHRGQHQAFGDELAHDAPAARAARQTQADFRLARRPPREQQIREVRAGDQQQDTDRCEERRQ
jgi:hypothetical protein